MAFKIDKSVPVPNGDGRGRPMKYPWREMSVGDSVVVPEVKGYHCAFAYGKRHGIKFTMRTEGGKIRVWRIA